jgi:hypothetical protein
MTQMSADIPLSATEWTPPAVTRIAGGLSAPTF